MGSREEVQDLDTYPVIMHSQRKWDRNHEGSPLVREKEMLLGGGGYESPLFK